MEVTVALIGNPAKAGELDEDEWNSGKPFADRPTVRIAARTDETLAVVMRRAVEHFNARYQDGHSFWPAFISFYDPRDDWGYSWNLRTTLDVVDSTGKAIWNRHWYEVKVGDLLLAAESGLLREDPSRWYLVLVQPMGNGFFTDWSSVVAAWFIFEKLLSFLADAHGTSAAISNLLSKFRQRAGDFPELLDRHAVDWTDRGAAPPDLQRLMYFDSWDASSLSRLLGCSMNEVEAILWAHGYTYDIVDGVWRRSQTPESAFLAESATVINNVEFNVNQDKERLQGRIAGIFRRWQQHM